ncbi:MAG: LamG-like jellyroll fold domain-containing protein [Bacteroidia bacterium]
MKKLIILTTVACIALSTTIAQILPSYVPTTGLLGYWGFTGNAHDYSAKGNNGAVNGAILVQDRFAKTNKAYQFNVSQTIVVPDSDYLDGMTLGLTISFWVKLPAVTAPNILISKSTGCYITGDDAYAVSILSNGKLSVQLFDPAGNNNYQYGSIVVADNKWHHVAIAWYKPQTVIYVDGAADLGASYTLTFGPIGTSQDPLIFGHGNVSVCGVTYSYGEILDDICIYNRALSQSEIDALYSSCTGAPTAAITAIGNTSFCAGGDVLLKCSPGFGLTYQWKKNNSNISGATSSTYNVTTSGNYKCLVTNSCGTVTSNVIAVTSKANAIVTLTTSGSAAFCAGDSVTINASGTGTSYSLQWYRNDASLTGDSAHNYIAKQPGTYKVVSKNNTTGCSRISAGSVTTTVNCRMANPNLSTGSIESESSITNPINLYPNPNAGSFTFEYAGLSEDENGTATIQLYNSVGQKVYEFSIGVQNGHVSKELNLNGSVKNGIYLLKMEINNQVYDSKVMIN